MGDEQRRLFRETQAVMSLLEGFSDYVMDEVGKDLVPGRRADQRAVPRAADAADAVRAVDAPADRHGPQDGAVQEGRAFVRAIADARGPAALSRLWDGPETLPRDGEIEAPDALDRAGPRRRVAGMTDDRTRWSGPPARARPGRRPDRHRAEPDPVRPLPLARPRADPRRGTRRAPRHGLGRGPRRRPARRRRGHAPRLARPRTRSTGCWSAPRTSPGSTRRRRAWSGR